MKEHAGSRNLLTKESALVALGAVLAIALGVAGEQTRRKVIAPVTQLLGSQTMDEIVSRKTSRAFIGA